MSEFHRSDKLASFSLMGYIIAAVRAQLVFLMDGSIFVMYIREE